MTSSPAAGRPERADRAGLAGVARGSTLNLVGVIISAAATLGSTIIVTRHFSRSVAGAFFTATSLFLIVEAIANLGAYNGVIYFIARLRSVGADSKIPGMLRTAAIPVAVVSVLAAAAMLALAHPLARLLLGGHLSKGGAGAPGPVADAIRALAVTLPFAALLDTFLGASRGFRNMMPTVTIDRIARSALQLLGLLAVAAVGSSAMLAPVWSLPYIPASVAAWWWLRRVKRHALAHPTALQPPAMPDVPPALAALLAISTLVPPSGPPSSGAKLDDPGFASPRRFWAFTAPRALATVAQIVIQRLDIVLVAIFRGPVEAAVYAAATRFLVVGQLGNGALIQASQPQFSHLFSVGDRRAANTVYQATTAWLILLTWPLYLLAAIYGPEILAIFGHSYRAGSSVMIILSLTMIVATGCGQVDMVLTTAGRSSWSLLNGLLAVSINVAVDLALIPRYGITGAAVGWAAAIVISNLIPLFQVTWTIHVHPFGRGVLVAGLLTALSFAAIPLALRVALGTGPAVSIAGVAVGCIVQAAGLSRFRGALRLSVFPGVAAIARRVHRRKKPVTGPQPDIGHDSLRR